MREAYAVLAVLIGSAVALAGCASSPSNEVDDDSDDPVLHTSPTDFGDGVDNDTGRAHIHDYWGNAQEMVVFEAEDVGSSIWGAEHFPVLSFRPGEAQVFPQGTRWVNVSLEWTADSPDNRWTDPRLFVKTAADQDPVDLGPVENGVVFAFEVGEDAADLPHQQLSAWVFELRAVKPDDTPVPMLFDGEGSIAVSAARGYELPVFPPHPDQWKGATELDLMAPRTERADFWTTGPYGELCNPCPEGATGTMPMDSGAIVPMDASEVEVTIEYEDTPMHVDLGYHAANTREWTWIEPDDASEGLAVYHIPVTELMGDGPYSLQSLWEFVLFPSDDWHGQYSGTFTVSARVLR